MPIEPRSKPLTKAEQQQVLDFLKMALTETRRKDWALHPQKSLRELLLGPCSTVH